MINSRNHSTKIILAILAFAIAISVVAFAGEEIRQDFGEPPKHVSFSTEDGALIAADLYGNGTRGVVLVHGGRFTKESWEKQARVLVKAGFRVIAIDLRGFGQSKVPSNARPDTEPLYQDVLAAVRYLRKAGVKPISVVGGSMGASATADAAIKAKHGEIDRVVLLAGIGDYPPEKLKIRKLFVVTREDANGAGLRLPKIREYYEKTPEPKQLILMDGSAHAQFIFQTDQGERLMNDILTFLTAP